MTVMPKAKKITGRIFLLVVLFLFFSCNSRIQFVCAQSAEEKTAQTIQLQSELEAIEREIATYENQLSSVTSEKNTLNKKISESKLQQAKISAQIKQTNLNIKGLEERVSEIQQAIAERQKKIAAGEEDMAGMVRLIEKNDHHSVLITIVKHSTIGGFFDEIRRYRQTIASLQAAVIEMREDKAELEKTEQQLSAEMEDHGNFIAIANLQNQKLSDNLFERKNLLQKTKEQESEYQALLSDRKKRASEIKSRIYELLGISQAVTFGQAVSIAAWAEKETGVRTAFLLAILTQESNLGKNVGTCNRSNDPPEKSWKSIMKPDRDIEPFKTITAELGMDPNITPVSCPMRDSKGNRIGWGGAMGPAQFIPSTWIGYRDKITAITGTSANPWDIRDAFLGAAILLKANGAGSKDGEWAAAMRYFSGSTNARYRFYGDNVVALAEKYQQDINDLNYN